MKDEPIDGADAPRNPARRNLTAFVEAFTKDKTFRPDLRGEIQHGALTTHESEGKDARSRNALQQAEHCAETSA